MRRKNKRPTGKSVNIQTNKRSDFERYTDCSKAKKSPMITPRIQFLPLTFFIHKNTSTLNNQ